MDPGHAQGAPPTPQGRPGLPAFTVSAHHEVDRLRLAVSGELDIATAPELERTVAQALAATGPGADQHALVALVLDLSATAFIDLLGVRALCRCADLAAAARLRVSVLAAPQGRRVLALCGVTDRFELVCAAD